VNLGKFSVKQPPFVTLQVSRESKDTCELVLILQLGK